MEAKSRRGCVVELPWTTGKVNQLFILSVVWDANGDLPIWTLYEQNNMESKMHWSEQYPPGDLQIMYDVVAMSVTGSEGSAQIPESLRPKEFTQPGAAAPAAPAPAPASAPPMAPYAPPGFPPGGPNFAPMGAQMPPMGAVPQQMAPPQMAPPPYPGDPNAVPPGYAYPPQYYGAPAGYPPPQGAQPNWQYPAQPMAPGAPMPQQMAPPMPPQQMAPQMPPPAPTPPPAPAPAPVAPPAPAPASPGETSGPLSKVDYSLISKRSKLQLGKLLVDSKIISPATLQAALRIQELVEDGQVEEDSAHTVLGKWHTKGSAIGEFVNAPELEAEQPEEKARAKIGAIPEVSKLPITPPKSAAEAKGAFDLLKRSGILTEEDIKSASEVRRKHGGDIIQILQSAGKLDKYTFESATTCLPLIDLGLMKMEQVVIAIQYCCRMRVSFDTALEELGWQNPRKLRSDLQL